MIFISAWGTVEKNLSSRKFNENRDFVLVKNFSPIENLFTRKIMRRNEQNTIQNIIGYLKFFDSLKFKLPCRYQKIGTGQQFEEKIMKN